MCMVDSQISGVVNVDCNWLNKTGPTTDSQDMERKQTRFHCSIKILFYIYTINKTKVSTNSVHSAQ
jgi:hypothetical protein